MSFVEQQGRANPPLEQKQLYVASAGGVDVTVGSLREYFALTTSELALQRAQQKNKILETLTTTDGLTGVLNRSGLDKAIEEGLSKASRGRDTSGVAILMIDIDHFKNFNDTHGHKAGDAVLVAVAKTIKEQLRKHDIAGRWGGEEFCVFLDDNISHEDALKKAEQVRRAVESLSVAFEQKKLNTTVSIGVVAAKIGRDDDLQELHNTLFKTADRLLYASKANGRNRVTGEHGFVTGENNVADPVRHDPTKPNNKAKPAPA